VFGDAAGHDALEMRKLRLHIQCHAVVADPAPDPDADGGDLVLARSRIGRRSLAHPDADAAVAAFAHDVELAEGGDQPGLQILHEAPDVAVALLQIQHHIGHALARPVIGHAAAAAGLVDREATGIQHLVLGGTGASGVERWMLQQPDHFRRGAVTHRGHPLFHEADGGRIVHRVITDAPFDNRRVGQGCSAPRCGRGWSGGGGSLDRPGLSCYSPRVPRRRGACHAT